SDRERELFSRRGEKDRPPDHTCRGEQGLMARRGRPRKAGKRTKAGALVRDSYAMPIYDHGTERAQARFKRFGTHGATALGRAYASGLLGDEQEASIRYDAGKRFSRLYSALIEQGRYRCPLARERLSAGVVVPF